MSIQEFELFHGAALAKLLRAERPVTLRLVETRPAQAWSTYTLNDRVDLFVAHSKNPRTLTGGGTSWTFVLSGNQIGQLNPNGHERPVWAAFICGRATLAGKMEICLLDPDQIRDVFDFAVVGPQDITRRCPHGGRRIRVFKDRREHFLIPKSRFDTWNVPG